MHLAGVAPIAAAGIIPHDTVDFDPSGMCTTGAAAKVTIPVSGYYWVSAQARANAGTQFVVSLLKNGANYSNGNFTSTASEDASTVVDLVQCVAGDTIQSQVGLNGITTPGSSGGDLYLSVAWHSPA